MMFKFKQMKLDEPLNILKPIAENLWIIDSPIIKMSMLSVGKRDRDRKPGNPLQFSQRLD